ncbi:C_GCAxxG_C_C family protein [Candidatus Bathyarchaeota archaeon]|nr:C_GCAxxG_C_C family protein [Candidatus Bathyarchaeota archaeon]
MVQMVDKELVKKIRNMAHEYDKNSGCSQSVLLALQEGLMIGDLEAFKAATVLSGGVARRGETCGAILGGLMALGLAYGRERMENTNQYVKACKVADEICRDFQKQLEKEFGFKKPLGSMLCREIQEMIYGRSFDLRENTQREAFLKAGGHSEEGCYKVCGIAAEVSARKILQLKEK